MKQRSAWKSIFLLSAVIGLLWCVQMAVAHQWTGQAGVQGATVAAVANLLPGLLVLSVSAWLGESRRLAVVLAGTVLRMGVVLGALIAVRQIRPEWGWRDFHVWLLTDYFACLACETWILLRSVKSETGLNQDAKSLE